MRYRINVHRADGRTVRDFHVDARDHAAATSAGRVGLTRAEWNANYRVTADALPKAPKDGVCPRCGDRVSACGGPRNPHE